MLEHNGRQGSKGVDISYSPPPLVPPAWQLTSRQPWGLWLVMAFCLGPINAWPPLCPQRSHVNKSTENWPQMWDGWSSTYLENWVRADSWMVPQKKINKSRTEIERRQQEMAWQLSWQIQVTTVTREGKERPENSSIPRIKSAPDVGKPSRNKLTH